MEYYGKSIQRGFPVSLGILILKTFHNSKPSFSDYPPPNIMLGGKKKTKSNIMQGAACFGREGIPGSDCEGQLSP